MRAKILLTIGILLFGAAFPQTLIVTLQGASLPQTVEAASRNTIKNTSKLYLMYTNTFKYKKNVAIVAPSPRAQTLLPVVDQEDIKMEHRIMSDEVLRLMPKRCRDVLHNFYVRYDNPKNRGLAGKNTLIISGTVPRQEFRALLIHELGHVFDLSGEQACLSVTKESGYSTFRDGSELFYWNDPSVAFYQISWINEKTKRYQVKSEDFVTGYASWDPFEDFAESFAYFLLQNETFRKRALTNTAMAAKYKWFQTYLFPEDMHIATGKNSWNGIVPWDATKLAYSWHPQKPIAQK